MALAKPNIKTESPEIRQLAESAINRIAAGEVLERPASAVKELVENALDAGASKIEIAYADGGKSLIRVTDDGHGMRPEDLPLALSRHATSKIDGSDLLNIQSFGFRGEALASLAAVARLTLTSRSSGRDACQITAANGRVDAVKPAALSGGTVVEVRDLFFATPARLKFLRTDRAEAQAITDVVRRLAIAEPSVGFTLSDFSAGKRRVVLSLEPCSGDREAALGARLSRILGANFLENAIGLGAEREGLTLSGYAALPTYSRGSAVAQHFYVNGRPVRDKQLIGALRAAYSDLLSRDRHPAAALFIDCDPSLVDVNVHPAKSEVRFRNPAVARGLIVSGIRHALAEAGHRSATTLSEVALGAAQAAPEAPRVYQMDRPATYSNPGFADTSTVSSRVFEPSEQRAQEQTSQGPLGAARAQIHENYIIAQTADGVVIVDQHAAHERLVYERLKRQSKDSGVASQALLVPEIVEMSDGDCDRLLDHATALGDLGLVIEKFGPGAIAVRETPALLGQIDARALVLDILDELSDLGVSDTLQSRIDAIISRVSCHGSVRSGRAMRAEEMNALLREMEATPYSGQCNHGRPTYVELKLSDIERLFGRS